MSTGLERIAAKARQEPKLCFTRLAHHIDAAWRWQNLCHVPHHTAPGSDGQTAEALKQDFVPWSAATLRAVHTQGYRPPPVRRTYIPKPGKRELRPLGVPCIGDRVLQRSVADVLSAIYEQDFLPCPFGGRPGVGAARILDRPKHVYSGRSEVAQRLLAEVCEGGGSGEGPARSTTSVASPISIDRDRKTNLAESSGWHHATARRWSPAYGAIKISIGSARDGVRRRGTGKREEIETTHVQFGEGCDPFSRNLERSKGMGGEG